MKEKVNNKRKGEGGVDRLKKGKRVYYDSSLETIGRPKVVMGTSIITSATSYFRC